MTIYSLGYDFMVSLIGSDLASTVRGGLVCEYFGYFTVGICVFLLCKFCFTLIRTPFRILR